MARSGHDKKSHPWPDRAKSAWYRPRILATAAEPGLRENLMLFHASIGARDPMRVAAVVAEIWRGKAYPFPPCPGSYIALAGDDRGSAIEVYPTGRVLVPGENAVRSADRGEAPIASATHLAIAVPCSEEELARIAWREGWLCRSCDRGRFRVVELWLENSVLIEALTPEMQQQYREFANPANWEAFLAAAGVPADPRIGGWALPTAA
jgi:hypothetical protein